MLIFVGVTGSGKSVQGKLLATDLNSKYFSMGDFLRSHASKSVAEKLQAGELVNNAETIDILERALLEVKPGSHEFVLDGFPRTVEQADWLIRQTRAKKIEIAAVFHLIATPETVTGRLLQRHRPDDNMPTISKRIDEYNLNIEAIVKHLKTGGIKVYDIDAEAQSHEVHKQIMSKLS